MKITGFVKIIAVLALLSFLTAFLALFPSEKDSDSAQTDSTPNNVTDINFSEFASGSMYDYGEAPNVSAKSAILCSFDGEVLFEKQADIPLPMASITKLMTAVVALENITDLSEEITVPKEAVGIEGSSVYLKLGETVTYEMLLYSTLLESANDATTALAISVSGTEDAFVTEMNEKAKELCMTSTVFKNPHGLSEDGHYTTARDYSKLMAYALQNETLRDVISTKKKVYPSSDGSMTRVLTNHNRLLNTYSGMLGGKTGFTKASGRTLVTAAKRNGTVLICVTINAPDDWNDHSELFDYGFSELKTEEIKAENYQLTIPLAGGINEKASAVFEDFSVTVPSDAEISIEIQLPHMVFAPAEMGKTVGKIICKVNGDIKKEVVICLAEDCASSCDDAKSESFIDKIMGFFKK